MSEERESFMEAAFEGAMAQHRTCADQLAQCRATLVEIKRLCDSRAAEYVSPHEGNDFAWGEAEGAKSFAGECLAILSRYAEQLGTLKG
jgi:hypothetical protein